jgi:catechol 2,3-dioxygenase-like lactoylglutathione lyase family enzyme
MESPICQIALSVSDLERSRSWYRQLGLDPTGGMGPMSGELPARMLELPELEVTIGWLAGHDSMSQLELIHFSRPAPRALPRDFGPRYAGYGLMSLVVADFDSVLRRLRATPHEPTITGDRTSRSMWIRDPDGIPVEILEKDPLGLRGPDREPPRLTSIRTITLTVGDLERAKRFWTSAVGLSALPAGDYAFNSFPADLDGGAGDWEQALLRGGSVLVRLLKPRRAAILPRPPGWRLSDAGVLNIAIIVEDPKAFTDLVVRVRKLGYTFTTETPMTMGDNAGTIYGHDDQGTSIEIGFVLPGHEAKYGWRR